MENTLCFSKGLLFPSFYLSHRRFSSDLHHENQSWQKSQAFSLHILLLPHGFSPLSETPVSHMMDPFTMPHVSFALLCFFYHLSLQFGFFFLTYILIHLFSFDSVILGDFSFNVKHINGKV